MSPTLTSPLDLWVKRVVTATLLAVVLALISVGLILYGPGARAQGFSAQDRPLATTGDVR